MKRFFLPLLLIVSPALFAQQTVPEIPFDGDINFLKLPAGMNLGEASGVAVNSKGEIAVFTRSNSAGGPAYGATASQLAQAVDRELAKLPKVEGGGAGQIYLAPETARVFDQAEQMAQKAGDQFVTIEYMLLALATEIGRAHV